MSIGLDGGAVPSGAREAPLIQRRRALVRAYWEFSDDWMQRMIEARLTLSYPGDTPDFVMSETMMIDGPASEYSLGKTINWGVPAENMLPGAEYRIELFETSAEYEDSPAGDAPPAAPMGAPPRSESRTATWSCASS